MLEFVQEQGETLALAVSLFALLLAFLALRRRRKNTKIRLKKDSSGMWKYHPDSEFTRKEAYAPKLPESGSENALSEKATVEKPLAVLSFQGDLKARQHEGFAKLVDEVVINKDELSEVVVRLTSPGGTVSEYGHVLSEMERLRSTGLLVTVCVDVVAASGGYLASLPASKIIAAPFAVVGSVGVVAFVPNIREFLRQHHIQPRTFTAGKFKRTVTLTDDAGPEETARFQNQLESIHRQFRDLVVRYRPQAKMEEIETGDHWTAKESQELGLGLVDELMTSSDYLLKSNRLKDLIEISHKKKFLEDGMGSILGAALERLSAR